MVSITVSVPEDVRKIKEELIKELSKEKDFNEWAVKIVREGRRNEARR